MKRSRLHQRLEQQVTDRHVVLVHNGAAIFPWLYYA